MSLFQPSLKAVSAACQEIADCVGASADTEMTTRAFRSLNAACEHFNNKSNWDFMRTEAPLVSVLAPFTLTGISASAGQSSAACPAGHGLSPEDFIVGSGFSAGTRVSATAASGFGIYGAVTGFTAGVTVVSAGITRDSYDLPTDWKKSYSVRLLASNRVVRYVGRRLYDRSTTNEQQTSTTCMYDLFTSGGKGKIRLLPPPNGADVLLMRYYRRITVATASGDSTVLEIPQDYEPYLIAWAKWHFLVDKGEGRGEQMKTWFVMAQEGLKTMMQDQTKNPDEDLGFIPGHYFYGTLGDYNTAALPWEYTG